MHYAAAGTVDVENPVQPGQVSPLGGPIRLVVLHVGRRHTQRRPDALRGLAPLPVGEFAGLLHVERGQEVPDAFPESGTAFDSLVAFGEQR